jgi:N-acetylglucosaminyldiphosphoundecaprenol N-acetyl-beta-D-mannosaminyltransferase
MTPRRIEVLGVPVDCVTMEAAVARVDELVRTRARAATVLAVNPEKVIKARQDPFLLRGLRQAGLLIPDGIGIVLAARLLGLARFERVPGCDLMLRICALAAERGYRVFLFGARPEVNEAAAAALQERWPGLNIAGRQHGYVEDAGMSAVLAAIRNARADILLVALGSPRQEQWLAAHGDALSVAVCQGVGGSFDVLAGAVRRAPVAWQRLNLEWAYRLLSQPRRLLRQTALPRFALQVLRAWLSRPWRQREVAP